MSFTRYTLTCDGCGDSFYSQEAFPKPQYCNSCLAIFEAGYKAGCDEITKAPLDETFEQGKQAGIKEVVEELRSRGDMSMNFPFANIRKEAWQAKLEDWNVSSPE